MKYSSLSLVVIAWSGCAPSNSTVSGNVYFKGQKVPSGTVTFVFNDVVKQASIENGAYEVKDLPQGEAIITVTRLDPNIPDPNERLLKLRKQMVEKQVSDPRELDPHIVTDAEGIEALQKKRHLLPYFYANTSTSDLRFVVEPGANTFDIHLQEK